LEKIGLPRSHFLQPSEFEDEIAESTAQNAIEGRTDIGDTQKQQLVQARRGQGIFKANVRLNESKCRFTGVTDPRLLIASHIKPWAISNDREKLDGCNGLLFSPHIDRLFDRGFISFKDDGTVL
jgi:predicted restriction endonuclease